MTDFALTVRLRRADFPMCFLYGMKFQCPVNPLIEELRSVRSPSPHPFSKDPLFVFFSDLFLGSLFCCC